jgi:dTDP-N-acetylfucosamine:lipid II N-acetylfucosaminyltransferase
MNLHIIGIGRYSDTLYDFIRRNYPINEHFFLFTTSNKDAELLEKENSILYADRGFFNLTKIIILLFKSNKIFIHGLYDARLIILYNFLFNFKKKIYWDVWGGDLLDPYDEIDSFKGKLIRSFKRLFMFRVKHVITSPLEFDFLVNNYNHNKVYHKAKYYQNYDFPLHLNKVSFNQIKQINIMIGQSAAIGNNHIEIFHRLEKIKLENSIMIHVPIAYGDKSYANDLERIGKSLFGSNIVFYKNHLSLKDYKEFLRDKIDIAIFNNQIQLGHANIVQLICYGKKLYLRSDNTHYKEYTNQGFVIYDTIADFDDSILEINYDASATNANLAKVVFSESAISNQWEKIFDI